MTTKISDHSDTILTDPITNQDVNMSEMARQHSRTCPGHMTKIIIVGSNIECRTGCQLWTFQATPRLPA
jgi:hypothetical protein